MKTTNHETKNPFAVFPLRGRCLCKRGPGVARYAPFLTGMALAVVLGSMVALSTPAFALGGGGGGGSAPAPKVTKVDDPVAKPKDEVVEVKKPVVNPGDKTPAVSELKTREPKEEKLALEDPAEDKTETKPDERTIEFPKPKTVEAVVGFAKSSSRVAENGGLLQIQVRISEPLPQPVTLHVATGGTATRGADYAILSTVTIPANATSASLTLTGIDDAADEVDETVILTLGGVLPAGVRFDNRAHIVTIIDNDVADEIEVVKKPKEETPEVAVRPGDDAGDDGTADTGDETDTDVEDKTETKPDERTTEFPKPEDKTGDETGTPEDETPEVAVKPDDNPGHIVILPGDEPDDDCSSYGEPPEEPKDYVFIFNGCVIDLDKFVEPPAIDEIIVGMGESGYEVASNGIAVTTATGQKKRCYLMFGQFRVFCLPGGSGAVSPPFTAYMVIDGKVVDYARGRVNYFSGSETVIEDTVFTTTSGSASGGDVGVNVPWHGDKHVFFTNNADIDGAGYGIKSTYDGKPVTGEGIELNIFNNGRILGAREHGIYAKHAGARDLRIYLENDRDDGLDSEIVSSGDGVVAQHDGKGSILVYVAEGVKIVSEEGDAVSVEKTVPVQRKNGKKGKVKGNVKVLVNGEVRGGRAGISMTHLGSEHNDILIGSEAEVHGGSFGIKTNSKRGYLTIDVAGKVSGAGGVAIDMNHGGTLLLRPGFSLDGVVVTDGYGRLKLGAPVSSGTFDVPVLDLSSKQFKGFDKLAVDGHWIVTGRMDEDWVFRSVDDATKGVLRLSDADIRMAGDYDDRWSRFDMNGTLIVSGSNRLRGSLELSGPLFFEQGSNDASPMDASLEVTGNYYHSGGALSFNVDLAGQKANKLTILGEVETGWRGPQSVSMRVPDESVSAEESPVLIDVHGYAGTGDFTGEDVIGAFRYVLAHEAVGEVLPVPSDEFDRYIDDMEREMYDYYDEIRDGINDRYYDISNPTEEERKAYREEINASYEAYHEAIDNLPTRDSFGYHTWRFVNQGLSDAAKKTSKIADELSDKIETPPANNPDKKPELGLWGEQNGSHTTIGLNALTTSLMGGDMVVGTSVSRNFSTSNNIDVESQVTALAASWERNGFYAGGQTRYARFTSDVSTDRLSVVRDNDGTGVNASVDLGYRFALPFGGVDFQVAPQMQLVWSRVNFDDFVGPHGELVSLEDGDLTTGRLGLSWDGEWQGAGGFGRIYGGMNLRSAVDGKTSVNISGVSIANERKGLSVDGKLGLSYEWDEGYAVRGEVSALRDDDADEIRADLGVRIDF